MPCFFLFVGLVSTGQSYFRWEFQEDRWIEVVVFFPTCFKPVSRKTVVLLCHIPGVGSDMILFHPISGKMSPLTECRADTDN